MFSNCSSRPNSGLQKCISYKCWLSVIYCVSKGSYGIKSYLFAAFLYPHNGWFVRSSLAVKPFIIGDISRLKGPYISNFCIIVGQVLYLEENYSLHFLLSVGGKKKKTQWGRNSLKNSCSWFFIFHSYLHSFLKLSVTCVIIAYKRQKKRSTCKDIIYSDVFAGFFFPFFFPFFTKAKLYNQPISRKQISFPVPLLFVKI